ncbi:MAG: pentapeptide repeat-containing protein [Treponema sp.]
MRGYKGFDQNLQCRGFQYEVGKTYKMDERPSLCERGFHFCQRLTDVHLFYDLQKSRICEIEADGCILHDTDGKKSACNEITIIRELTKKEILRLGNIGFKNSGSLNTGGRNSRDWNAGYFCSCDHSSGLFMSKRISYEAFNKKLSEAEYNRIITSRGWRILQRFKLADAIERGCKGGKKERAYLSYKASWRIFWDSLTPKEKLEIKRMPHFDAAVFYEITGIKI